MVERERERERAMQRWGISRGRDSWSERGRYIEGEIDVKTGGEREGERDMGEG